MTSNSTVKLLVATPSIDHKYHDDYLHSQMRLQRACEQNGIEYNLRTLKGHSLIPVARAILLRDFMQTQCTHLLFWDSDIGAQPDVIMDLITADKPLIGAVCVQKRYDWENIRRAADNLAVGLDPLLLAKAGGIFTFSTTDAGEDVDVSARNPVPVKYVGMGLTLIKRSLIETMEQHFRSQRVKLPGGPAFPPLTAQRIVDCGNPEGATWLSEDYAFCSRAFDCGVQPYLAWWTRTTHTGQHTFEGDLLTAGEMLGGVTQQYD